MSDIRITLRRREDGRTGVFMTGINPYDAARLLIATALDLLEGNVNVVFNDGPPLSEEEEDEVFASIPEEGFDPDGGHDAKREH